MCIEGEHKDEEMRGWKRSILAILALLLLASFSAVNVASAEKAVIVSNVRDLYDYEPTGNTFTRGSTLKVYTEMRGVNYEDFVLVDFVFIITDSTMREVNLIDRMYVRRRDCNDTVYVEYTVDIPSWMAYGEHRIKIAAYNRLDKSTINKLDRKLLSPRDLNKILDSLDDERYGYDQRQSDPYHDILDDGRYANDQSQYKYYYNVEFEDVVALYANVCGGNEERLEELGVLKDFEDSIMEITYLKFFVVREEETEGTKEREQKLSPKSEFTVTDFRMSKSTVKPNETVSISVTVKNGGMRGTEKMALALNDVIEFEESVTLGYQRSKTLFYQVKKDIPGQYKVTIPGTNMVKQLFVEARYGEEERVKPSYSFSAPKMPEAGGALALVYLPVVSLLSQQVPYP
ncbi:hypothetical protein C5S53_16280 [Methanophagales archaeon]|nr:hypothetical protein C5S53_16280 [Methanophagales archaeon]